MTAWREYNPLVLARRLWGTGGVLLSGIETRLAGKVSGLAVS